jgi:hypothetical protein
MVPKLVTVTPPAPPSTTPISPEISAFFALAEPLTIVPPPVTLIA